MITVLTFFQTLALLLQMELQWPPELRLLMEKMSFLNINLELGMDHKQVTLITICIHSLAHAKNSPSCSLSLF